MIKRNVSIVCAGLLTLVLISWGVVGHKTVAAIAENHLTANAKGAIQSLLGNESIADVASWADEVRNEPEYRETGPWHYVNLSIGMSYEQFASAVTAQGKNNIYGALLNCQNELKSKTTSREQKITALKFIVHFVGDAHQPMHVSRAEDKGGNTIQVQFDGKGTNLHSLWDSKLIDKQGLTFEQMAKEYDTATPVEIKKWQNDTMMQWLWESYQLSSRLYTEANKGSKLGDSYYKQHIAIVQQRIEMAGIRLAGVLNEVFKNTVVDNKPIASKDVAEALANKATKGIINTIDVKDVANHIGETVGVCAKVYSYKVFENMTLINLGGEYPNQPLTVVLKGDAIKAFSNLQGKNICVNGKLILYKGKPEIILTSDPTLGLSGNSQ